MKLFIKNFEKLKKNLQQLIEFLSSRPPIRPDYSQLEQMAEVYRLQVDFVQLTNFVQLLQIDFLHLNPKIL